jgi:hypothetical protein
LHLWRFQGALWHTHCGSDVDHCKTLLLDSRGVEWPRSSNLIGVTLASLKPFVFHGLKQALPFSDTVEASAPRNPRRAGKVRAVLLAMRSA